jgi:3-mercaptopyruvate sulfurtransferase SseA/glyoxylase-like metal-dependent hydrolase (beta-lactamase superfamily II)
VGDTGRGSEGRANAGFIVTGEGVVAIDAGASPREGEALLGAIRSVTRRPIRWLVLTHHHPDHHFGAIAFRRAGAKVIAHPERRTLASEGGDTVLVANWTRVVGRSAMHGFALADVPDRPVERADTLRLGGRTVVIQSPGPAHTPGDLLVWLPAERVLFAGDLLVEDGVTMIVDGSSGTLLAALDAMARLAPRALVPGHGSIPSQPGRLLDSTRAYVMGLRKDMRAAVDRGVPMNRALAALPPADSTRPVSLNSRRRRNAVRAYVEAEREMFGFDADTAAVPATPRAAAPPADPRAALISTDTLAAWQARGEAFRLVDVRPDVFLYLAGHLPDAVFLHRESLRAAESGLPTGLLPADWYGRLFSRIGIRWDRPVVVYSAGESLDIDATFLVWLLAGHGHPRVYLLDGGYARWSLDGRPIARKYPRFDPAPAPPTPFAPAVAELADVKRAAEDGGALLVDARPPDQYSGQAGAQMRRGHIPRALSHFWQDDLESRGGALVWKSKEELRKAYAGQGVTPDRDIIVYCNTSTEASHVYFALRYLLEYPRVRIYARSWNEWAENEALPVER